jgi:hypothetical protein
MFGAYMDESGAHARNLLIESGCVASVERWTSFENGWRGILADFHLPYLHFKEFFNSPPSLPFRKLTDTDKSKIVSRAAVIIRDSLLFVFTCTISPDLYKSLTTGAFRSKHGSAYGIAVQVFLGQVSNLLAQPVTDYQILNVFLEHGHKNAADALRLIRLIKLDTDPVPEEIQSTSIKGPEDPMRGKSIIKIGKFGLGSKSGLDAMLPLQAADFFAYATHRLIRYQGDPGAETFLRGVETKVPHYGCNIDESTIRELVDAIAEKEAENAILKKETYALKKYLRSFKLRVFERPYGLVIDGSDTPRSEVDRFVVGDYFTASVDDGANTLGTLITDMK